MGKGQLKRPLELSWELVEVKVIDRNQTGTRPTNDTLVMTLAPRWAEMFVIHEFYRWNMDPAEILEALD